MNSLTYKLAAIFLAMSLVPLVIGINAALSMRTAGTALDANDRALKNLSGLLSAAGDGIAESSRIQDTANQVTTMVASAQEDTSAALRDMGDEMLPKTFAIAQIRFALTEVTAAERALLLALSMRHLEPDELRTTRDGHVHNMQTALAALMGACDRYEGLISTREETEAWRSLQEAIAAWRANHDEFMAEIAKLEELVTDLVRGGPVFASVSRRAYDTIFLSGKEAREECEERIEVLNAALVRTAEANVQNAMRSQAKSNELLQDLGRETEAASMRASGLRQQIDLAKTASETAASEAAAALQTTSERFRWLVIFSILLVGGAVVAGVIMAWRISRPVRDMAHHLSLVAKGDITADVPAADLRREDEIGQLARSLQEVVAANRQEISMANAMAMGDYTSPISLRSESDQLGWALRTMLANSNDTLIQVSQAVEQVSNGSQAVSGASRSLSQGAQTSAQALEEISQTAVHVDSQAKDNAANARDAKKLATDSLDSARRGYDAVQELVGSMSEIRTAGKNIAKVAKLIDDIAFQTNLLALNAAVEAARAGRQGKGFSVVADEVRNLSGRSAKAARETGAMVTAMTQRMDEGAALAERSDAEFREIVEATGRVAEVFENITSASNAQSEAMAQIAQGLSQIDQVIQETTQNAQQTAISAHTLERQADALRGMVSQFNLISDAGAARAILRSVCTIPTAAPAKQEAPEGAGSYRLLGSDDREV